MCGLRDLPRTALKSTSLALLLASSLAAQPLADPFLDPMLGNWRLSGQVAGVLLQEKARAIREGGRIHLQLPDSQLYLSRAGEGYVAERKTEQGICAPVPSREGGGYLHFVFPTPEGELRHTFVPGRERWCIQSDQRTLPDGNWRPQATLFFER